MALPFTETWARVASTNLGPNWTEVGGKKWAISQGALTCTQANHSAEMLCISTVVPGTADYLVRVAVAGGAPLGGAGVVGRYLDTNNFYLLDLNMNTLRLYVKQAGVFTMLGSATAGSDTGALGLGLQGRTITGALNGTVRLTAQDARLPAAGQFGLRNGADISTWGTVQVTALLAPPVAVAQSRAVGLRFAVAPPATGTTGALVLALPVPLTTDLALHWEAR